MKNLAFTILFALAFTTSATLAQTAIIEFPVGSSPATIKGHVNPLSSKSYKLIVNANQRVSIQLTSTSRKKLVQFTVNRDQHKVSPVTGADGVTQWEGVFKKGGDYWISVYALRDAGEENFTLVISTPSDNQADENSGAEESSSGDCGAFSGSYETNYGELKLTRKGDRVRGLYKTDVEGDSTLTGTVSGNVLTGTWKQPGETGRFRFTLGKNGRNFTGSFTTNGAPGRGKWNGHCSR